MRPVRTLIQKIKSESHVRQSFGAAFPFSGIRKECEMARRSRYLRYVEAVSMARKQGDETAKAAWRMGSHGSVLKRLKELRTQDMKETAGKQTTETGGAHE